jgi:hypothetical protein
VCRRIRHTQREKNEQNADGGKEEEEIPLIFFFFSIFLYQFFVMCLCVYLPFQNFSKSARFCIFLVQGGHALVPREIRLDADNDTANSIISSI